MRGRDLVRDNVKGDYQHIFHADGGSSSLDRAHAIIGFAIKRNLSEVPRSLGRNRRVPAPSEFDQEPTCKDHVVLQVALDGLAVVW